MARSHSATYVLQNSWVGAWHCHALARIWTWQCHVPTECVGSDAAIAFSFRDSAIAFRHLCVAKQHKQQGNGMIKRDESRLYDFWVMGVMEVKTRVYLGRSPPRCR
jgi:hypothetical protein